MLYASESSNDSIGQGKIRSDRTGAAKSPHLWRVAVLSTGEYSIRACLAEAGIDIKSGQELRLVDLPVTGEGFGIFSWLHGVPSPAQFANQLRAAAAADFGHADKSIAKNPGRTTAPTLLWFSASC